ncbi:MAG: hypothetical protein K0R54_227 [Clostridiaceae bacterium]|jgi:flagellar biosynthesis protein FliQ|nr:hypothetical protein [Clostridiaceae bacterium]
MKGETKVMYEEKEKNKYKIFSDIYQSKEMKTILKHAIPLKDECKIMRTLTIVSLVLGIVSSGLLASVDIQPELLRFVPVSIGIIIFIMYNGRTKLFEIYYTKTIIPFLSEELKLKMSYMNTAEGLRKYSLTPLAKLHNWNKGRCWRAIKVKFIDKKLVDDVYIGQFELFQRSSGDKNNSTKTTFKGMAMHIPMDLNLEYDVSIKYDSKIGSFIEKTGRTINKQKKIFEFTNSVLEKYFDCEITDCDINDYMHYQGNEDNFTEKKYNEMRKKEEISKIIVRSRKQNEEDKAKYGDETYFQKFERRSNERESNHFEYDKAHLLAQDFLSASMEEFLFFIFETYGPFNLLIRRSGIYIELFKELKVDKIPNVEINGVNVGFIANIVMRIFKDTSYKNFNRDGVGNQSVNFISPGLFEDSLKFSAMNDNFEIFSLVNIIVTYFERVYKNEGYEGYEEELEYFESIKELKKLKPKEINKEFEDYYNSVAEEGSLEYKNNKEKGE